MNRYINAVYVFIILLMIFGCEDPVKKIDWDYHEMPPKLIINGKITNEYKQHEILITQTQQYDDSRAFKGIEDCDVRVHAGTTSYEYHAVGSHPGLYRSAIAFAGTRNQQYELEIYPPDNNEYPDVITATETMPDGVDIHQAAAYITDTYEYEDTVEMSLMVYYEGSSEKPVNNYFIQYIVRQDEVPPALNLDILTSEEYMEEDSVRIAYFGYFDYYQAGESIDVVVKTITETHFRFLEGVRRISEPGDIFGFSTPIGNAQGNLNEGDVLGFFSTEYESTKKVAIISYAMK
ncbi:MAG: DUF4249 family protein [Bacteroidota bacterium]